MSRDNVEVVRTGWNAWLRGDLPALFRQFAPDIVWDTTHFRDWPESTYHGIDGVERFLDDWLYVWDEYEVGIDDVVEAPDGRVLTLLWHRGKGRNSGIAMELKMAQVATVEDGKITRLENYDDRTKAREAVGLRE